MPTSIPRIAYFGQKATVTTKAGGLYTLPVSTANIEVTRPIEAVTAFGKFNSLNTAQTNLTTCKSSLKCYMGRGQNINSVSSALGSLLTDTQNGDLITIAVGPAGFSMLGILTSVGIDISLGGFGMIDLGFAGVGNPTIDPAENATTIQGETFAIEPITTMSVNIPDVSATSLKFSYDLPTDVLGALGENPDAAQEAMVSRIATKAPYKSTLTVEGYGVNITRNVLKDQNLRSAVTIGDIQVQLPNGKASARSFNNAAGQVSATFSYTVEDVGAILKYQELNPYQQIFDQTNIPSYGSDLLNN